MNKMDLGSPDYSLQRHIFKNQISKTVFDGHVDMKIKVKFQLQTSSNSCVLRISSYPYFLKLRFLAICQMTHHINQSYIYVRSHSIVTTGLDHQN